MIYNDETSPERDMTSIEDESSITDTHEPESTESTESSTTSQNGAGKELQELRDAYFHLSADFKNYQRRVEKEREQWTFKAQERLLQGVLAIADDIDRALQEQHKFADRPDMKAWVDGLQMIAKSLHTFLEHNGVQEMSQMQEFDPNLHEALVQVSQPDVPAGAIVNVIQKGYLYKGIVLRPAKVAVAA